jgi:hypothetical protein
MDQRNQINQMDQRNQINQIGQTDIFILRRSPAGVREVSFP